MTINPANQTAYNEHTVSPVTPFPERGRQTVDYIEAQNTTARECDRLKSSSGRTRSHPAQAGSATSTSAPTKLSRRMAVGALALAIQHRAGTRSRRPASTRSVRPGPPLDPAPATGTYRRAMVPERTSVRPRTASV